jgi:hypothetical protein
MGDKLEVNKEKDGNAGILKVLGWKEFRNKFKEEY